MNRDFLYLRNLIVQNMESAHNILLALQFIVMVIFIDQNLNPCHIVMNYYSYEHSDLLLSSTLLEILIRWNWSVAVSRCGLLNTDLDAYLRDWI